MTDKIKKYEEKYDIVVKGGASSFKQSDRERNIIHLMRVNILKRLESSVHSYNLTLTKIAGKISILLDTVDSFSGSEKYKLKGMEK